MQKIRLLLMKQIKRVSLSLSLFAALLSRIKLIKFFGGIRDTICVSMRIWVYVHM